MYNSILYIYSCSFVLIRCNPLQRFPSSPINQHREYYRNEQRMQPSYFESYPQLFMSQNPLTTYQEVPISLNDFVQGVYINNLLQNEINSAINSNNCEQHGPKFRRYALNPADLFTPNVVNNYYIVSPDNYQKNETKNCNKRNGTEKSTSNDNIEHKTKKKCKKRKRSECTNEEGDKNKRKCSRNKKHNEENNGHNINQSNNQDVKGDRKKKSEDESQSLLDREEKNVDHSIVNTKKTSAKQINSSNQNIEKNYLQCTDVTPSESGKRVKTKKNKSNTNQKLTKKVNSNDLSRLLELIDCYHINNDCAESNNRCTRNYSEDNIQKYQQQYHISSDYTNMAPYMMFNQQLFNTDGYYPYNFDYIYNMQQFPSANSNPSQKKQKNRRVNIRNNHKKHKNKNCDRNKENTQAETFDKVVELTPKSIEDQTTYKAVTTQVEKPQIERSFHDVSDVNNENIEESLKLSYEEDFPPVDDYYPQFHSDNVYLSKEEYDWDIFHDRHYYSSSDMSDLDRERRKYDSTDYTNTFQNNEIIVHGNNFKPSSDMKIENEKKKTEKEIIMNAEDIGEKDDDKTNKSSEEILFRPPPALEFPDFKTEMINKDNHDMKTEIIYQTNIKPVNEYKNYKISNYSNVKKADNEKRNTIVDQNYVETVFGHSKVAKYGTPPNKDEKMADIENNYNNNNLNSNDVKTTIVIAKSLPYPIV